MHCNSERRILQTLRHLAGEPECLHTFFERYSKRSATGQNLNAAQLKPLWLDFLDLCELDPYTSERVEFVRARPDDVRSQNWVDSALDCCRAHDAEFNLALEEAVLDRFQLAVRLLQEEERFATIELP